MNLQIPPELARQKQLQQLQTNQLYTTAFQIYIQRAWGNEDVQEARAWAFKSIELARIFHAVVKHDMENQRGS